MRLKYPRDSFTVGSHHIDSVLTGTQLKGNIVDERFRQHYRDRVKRKTILPRQEVQWAISLFPFVTPFFFFLHFFFQFDIEPIFKLNNMTSTPYGIANTFNFLAKTKKRTKKYEEETCVVNLISVWTLNVGIGMHKKKIIFVKYKNWLYESEEKRCFRFFFFLLRWRDDDALLPCNHTIKYKPFIHSCDNALHA